jgi:hypothetical protein
VSLKWIPGKPCNGQVYYAEAMAGRVKLTLCRVTINSEHVYELWKDKAHVKSFWTVHGGKQAALARAEEIANERNTDQAA